MALFIGEYGRSSFSYRRLRTVSFNRSCPGEKLGIFQVNRAVPNENQIMHFQCKEEKPDELARRRGV